MTSNLTQRFRLPTSVIRQAAPLGRRERLKLLGYLLTRGDLPLRPRVAAIIVLLYAQPLSRLVRLTIDDVTHDGDQALLRLGDPPSPLPAPVADLLLAWIDNRDNMNTATPAGCFPAAAPDNPRSPTPSPRWSATSASPPPPAGPAPSASASWKCPHRSSPRPWATTTSPRPNSPPNPEVPGAGTSPGTTHRHHQAEPSTEFTTVE
jgi:hypothetical protein